LISIQKATHDIDLEVIVVDNNSADNSVEMVKSKFPAYTILANKENLGFSKANNQAIRQAKGEYILLLNPDTVLQEDTLEKSLQFMDTHPKAGGLGVMMLDGKGNFLPESKRGLPTPKVAFYKIFGLSAIFPKSRKFGAYHLGYLDKNKTHEIDVLSGAYMFLRKSTLEITGLLDEDYFMYGEDIDLSYRITKAGFKNYYFPDTRIIHYKGESTKRSSINYVFIFYRAMIIFAKKHFTNTNASIFSSLINIAIYLRAGISVLNRMLKKMAIPMVDFSLIYGAMYFFKNYYEINFKKPNHYPSEFIQWTVPIYIITWITATFFSGGYDKRVKSFHILRGVLVGTVLISAVSNFFDLYRYSKLMILLGGMWAGLSMLLVRMISQYIYHGNWTLGEKNLKRIVILGGKEEYDRTVQLINNSSTPTEIIGFVSQNPEPNNEHYLGKFERINDIIRLYHVDELIFCAKDFTAKQIIASMIDLEYSQLSFKILPDNSNYIIGSNSKNDAGEFYTLNIELNIMQSSARRNKRLLDVLVSVFVLIFSPINLIIFKKPQYLISQAWKVLKGTSTWVGFSENLSVQVPKIKPGIISPTSPYPSSTLDQATVNKLNMLYAKNYTIYLDIWIIFKAVKNTWSIEA
jgi:GT2 family glycosyltransferase